jgi:hypothetical protein
MLELFQHRGAEGTEGFLDWIIDFEEALPKSDKN